MRLGRSGVLRTLRSLRSTWLLRGALLAILACGTGVLASHSVANSARERSLSIYNIHTKETTSAVFKRGGQFVPAGLERLSWAMRDWRQNEPTEMDPALIDLLWEIHTELGSQEPVHLISGYRSRKTNNKLRKTRGGQAKNSRHIQGKAADVHFPDVPVRRLRYSALVREVGGVGYYPTSAIPFVHIDTGRIAHWPRMGRNELALLFPNGRTKHRPSGGGKITRRDFEKARTRKPELARKVAAFHADRAAPKSDGFRPAATQLAKADTTPGSNRRAPAEPLRSVPVPELASFGRTARPSVRALTVADVAPAAGGAWETATRALPEPFALPQPQPQVQGMPQPAAEAPVVVAEAQPTAPAPIAAPRDANDGVLAALALPLKPMSTSPTDSSSNQASDRGPETVATSDSTDPVTAASELLIASADVPAPITAERPAGVSTLQLAQADLAANASAVGTLAPDASTVVGNDISPFEASTQDAWSVAAALASQVASFFSDASEEAFGPKDQSRMGLGLADVDLLSASGQQTAQPGITTLKLPRRALKDQAAATPNAVESLRLMPSVAGLQAPIGDVDRRALPTVSPVLAETPAQASEATTNVTALNPSGWATAPVWDAEHPSELSYRPFPVGPLISEDPTVDDPKFVRLIHPDVASARAMIGEDLGGVPLRFKPGLQYAEMLWADLFTGGNLDDVLASGYQVRGMDNRRVRTARN